MRPHRPFDPKALNPGEVSSWLISPEDDVDVTMKIRRGGDEGSVASVVPGKERFAFVLEGEVVLFNGGETSTAKAGELIFIPAAKDGAVTGKADSVWAEIEAPLPAGAMTSTAPAKVIPVDPSKFEGTGFAHQPLVDRGMGAQSLRMNVLQVAPGAGSPDYHIHAFAQIYIIQEGEMTVDVGRKRFVAAKDSVVFLPAGVVHRNFNASNAVERHVSLLVPEPLEGEIFDFAVTIHDREAELLQALPN